MYILAVSTAIIFLFSGAMTLGSILGFISLGEYFNLFAAVCCGAAISRFYEVIILLSNKGSKHE